MVAGGQLQRQLDAVIALREGELRGGAAIRDEEAAAAAASSSSSIDSSGNSGSRSSSGQAQALPDSGLRRVFTPVRGVFV